MAATKILNSEMFCFPYRLFSLTLFVFTKSGQNLSPPSANTVTEANVLEEEETNKMRKT